MTKDEQALFDKACALNDQAGCLLLHGFRFEASLALEDAAVFAVSREAKVELLWRAALLRWGLKLPITIH